MTHDLDNALLERLEARKAVEPAKIPKHVPRPVFEKGRYSPPSITRLVALVAKHADTSSESIRGNGRVKRLVNARSCVAKLAEEYAPRLAAQAVDDAMLRGRGMTIWYRERHEDRSALYPDYKALYERCRDELRAV